MSTYSHTRTLQIVKSQQISHFFNLRYSIVTLQNFEIGGTLCKILEIGRFFGSTSEGSKDRKYLSDFSLIGMDGLGIYSSF